MKIVFHPSIETPSLLKHAKEYNDIWANESESIINTIEKISGLSYPYDKTIHSLITIGSMSTSYPFILKAGENLQIKRTTLIHELLHRYLASNKITGVEQSLARLAAFSKDQPNLASHKILNLIFYDILNDLYGVEDATMCVDREKKQSPMYKKAWEWALSMTKDQRKQTFQEIVSKKTEVESA